jgi:hypothetical protein
MKRVAIIQSNYIPWKGYFDIVHDVDLFVFHDDLQYTKNDWRNRNKIKTPKGATWLSIPVGTDEHRLICEVELKDPTWARKHWEQIKQHYAGAPHFDDYRVFFEHTYLATAWRTLSELNQFLIRTVARDFLGISAEFADSRAYGLTKRKQERVIELLMKAEASVYVSGPAAKSYIDETDFRDAGIDVVWKDYGGYPEYPQFHPPFDHAVTILDLLFHTGARAPWFIWGWRGRSDATA